MRIGAAGRDRVPGLLSRSCRWRKREVLDVVLSMCTPAPLARGSGGSQAIPLRFFADQEPNLVSEMPVCADRSQGRSA